MRTCKDYPEIFDDDIPDTKNFCKKKHGHVSKMSETYVEGYEPIIDKFVEPCSDGWTRVGIRLCVPGRPLGWSDHGDRCMKTGTVNLIPFVWQPGDEYTK